jgi:hypothetical protein
MRAGFIKFQAMAYEERYCAYLDILGFRGLIRDLSTGSISVEKIKAVLHAVHNPPGRNVTSAAEEDDVRVTNISDAVCISALQTKAALMQLFWQITELSKALLDEGFFVRGALVKGKLYHDENMVFGEALVKAYEYESTIVRYPRVMVTRDIVEDTKVDGQAGTAATLYLAQSLDGPYFLDMLTFLRLDVDTAADADERAEALNRCQAIGAQIQRRFDESIDNPRHFEKVQWFARYWNRHLVTPYLQPGVQLVKGPGTMSPVLSTGIF